MIKKEYCGASTTLKEVEAICNEFEGFLEEQGIARLSPRLGKSF
jgi:molecular chaperone GrpE (heat shock protein)